MLWLKACPRCKKGDLVLNKDVYGRYRTCVQCGYSDDLPGEETPAQAPTAGTTKEAVLSGATQGETTQGRAA